MPKPPARDFPSLARRYQGSLKGEQLDGLAEELGVSAGSLKRLGVGWNGSAFAFPMRNALDRIIGIRLRYRSGSKAAERGSRQGLFVPVGLRAQGLLLICEGPTDVAAALDLEFAAVGRPSCNSGTRMLAKLARGQEVVIVGDNDTPGTKGAEALASELVLYCPAVRLVHPPVGVKDLRQWKAKGLKREQLEQAISNSAIVGVRISSTIKNTEAQVRHG